MKNFLNWYKDDIIPTGTLSNKQVFWFGVISFTALIIKIIQTYEQ